MAVVGVAAATMAASGEVVVRAARAAALMVVGSTAETVGEVMGAVATEVAAKAVVAGAGVAMVVVVWVVAELVEADLAAEA